MRHKSSILFSSVCFEVYVEVEAESLSVNYEQHVFDVTPRFSTENFIPSSSFRLTGTVWSLISLKPLRRFFRQPFQELFYGVWRLGRLKLGDFPCQGLGIWWSVVVVNIPEFEYLGPFVYWTWKFQRFFKIVPCLSLKWLTFLFANAHKKLKSHGRYITARLFPPNLLLEKIFITERDSRHET